MNAMPLPVRVKDCWNVIGVRGDRSCPELVKHVHCQNCPVFADAGRRFLDAPSPPGYLEEWTGRLAAPADEAATDAQSVLVFRLGEEWLALAVQVLVEVTPPRPVHRVPYRAGLLAGLVNIRGELQLCVHLTKLLGINPQTTPSTDPRREGLRRYLVVRRETERWVLPVDAVDRVCRIAHRDIQPAPATLQRATAHIAKGVFSWEGRPVGLLDDARLFDALRRKVR